MFNPNARFASRHGEDCSRDRERVPEEQVLSVLTCDRCARVATRLCSLRGRPNDFIKVKATYQAYREKRERDEKEGKPSKPSTYRPIPKPESLEEIHVRFGETVHYSEEPLKGWATLLGTRPQRLQAIIDHKPLLPRQQKGPSRLTVRELIVVDDLTGRNFLTPPERDYAVMTEERVARQRIYKGAKV